MFPLFALSNFQHRFSSITVTSPSAWISSSSKDTFFHTISRKIQFRTIAHVTNRSRKTISRETNAVLNMYQARGFNVPDIHGNNEFACITQDILPTRMNVTAADNHVGDFERSICTTKERVRTTVHGLPFKRIPKLMVCGLVINSTKNLNQFPSYNGVPTMEYRIP